MGHVVVRDGHRPTFFQLHLMKTFVLVLSFLSINLKANAQLSSSSAQLTTIPFTSTTLNPTISTVTTSTTNTFTTTHTGSTTNTFSITHTGSTTNTGITTPSESPGISTSIVAAFTSPVATTVATVVGQSFSASSSQPTQSTSTSSSTTSSSQKSPRVGIIVGVVIGAIVFVLLLVLYIRRRNNQRILNENYNPKPFLSFPNSSLNHTSASEVPSLIPQLFSSKLSRRESANALATTSGSNSSSLAPSRNDPAKTTIRNIETVPVSQQPSISAQGDFLQHADSGIRMPHAERNLVELPPVYTCS